MRRCGSLAELNRLFTARCHQHYHRGVHSETGTTPAQRYHAEGRDRPPTPDPALLRRAFLWREQRKVTAFATVSLHGNRYEVDAALVGRTVDLLFTLFDLTVIDVEYQPVPWAPPARTTSAGMSTPRSNPTTPPRSRPPASTTCGCSNTPTTPKSATRSTTPP